MEYGGKTIGTVDNGILVKKGKQARKFYKYDGFAIPEDILGEIDRVRVHYRDEIWEAPIQRFKEMGIPYHSEGYEAQLVLPRRCWYISNNRQLSLFGGHKLNFEERV